MRIPEQPDPDQARLIYRERVTIDTVRLDLPARRRIVHVDSRTIDSVDFWYERPAAPDAVETLEFQIIGTGHSIPTGWEHIGSAIAAGSDGRLVWHLYGRDAE